MPNDDFALVCSLEDIQQKLVNKKIRIAGKILGYDPSTYLLILVDPPQAVLVDMTLCLDPSQSLHFLKELRGNLMVMGTLEYSKTPLDIPMLSKYADAPSLDEHLVLRAILCKSVNDMNMAQWRKGVQALREIHS
ncbi:hypothetical protein Clacol_000408 [Clathrus columnatus]|uniref:Uncharacterized protein n=1 Tax=Clathrus columnatus TaxID=1419009 RepID=A0AAV4ZZ82_9AGAM|nr:hypothetical protein Clacol_000408 [Clathrus columnatus]